MCARAHVCVCMCVCVCGIYHQQPNAGSTRAKSGEGLCHSASCSWLLHSALTSAQDGLDPQQLALVVFFLPPNSAKTTRTLAVDITCNLSWWYFSCAN